MIIDGADPFVCGINGRSLRDCRLQSAVAELAEFRFQLRQFLNFSEISSGAARHSGQQDQLLQGHCGSARGSTGISQLPCGPHGASPQQHCRACGSRGACGSYAVTTTETYCCSIIKLTPTGEQVLRTLNMFRSWSASPNALCIHCVLLATPTRCRYKPRAPALPEPSLADTE